MQNPLISFIMPVYNREQTLMAAVHSITESAFQNYEIILVDDCSTDHSWRICGELADTDARIRITRNRENMGPGLSRNNGLQIAAGKYIHFIDSDDKIDGAVLRRIADVLTFSPQIDILTCNHVEITQDGTFQKKIISDEKLWNTDELLENNPNFLFMSLWKSIYRRELIFKNGIVFYPLRTGEDVCFNATAFLYSKSVYTMPDLFYYYIQSQQNSIIATETTEERSNSLKLCVQYLLSIAEKESLSGVRQRALDAFIYITAIYLLSRTPLDNILEDRLYRSEIQVLPPDMICRVSTVRSYGIMGCVNMLWDFLLSCLDKAERESTSLFFCPASDIPVLIGKKIMDIDRKISGYLDNNPQPDNPNVIFAARVAPFPVYGFKVLDQYSLKKPFIIGWGSVGATKSIASQLAEMGLNAQEKYLHFI